jgi:hypothetical protein
METEIKIVINKLTEGDMRDVFHNAIGRLGVQECATIPPDMFALREAVIQLMFYGYKGVLKSNE